MSRAAASIVVFGVYIAIVGMALVFAPNLLLPLVGVPTTGEVWIRLAGMLLLILGFFYIQAGRHAIVPFFRWTLVTRLGAAFFVVGFVLARLVSPVIILFWLGDLAGAIWTALALRADGYSLVGKTNGR